MKLIGILLIVFGVVALAVGGFSYTQREKVLDIGPLQATTETRKSIPLSPIVGIAAVAGGIAMLVVGSRTKAGFLCSLAPGPHPRRELTPMPRLGSPCPRLGTPPQRGCRAGGPGMAAGAQSE